MPILETIVCDYCDAAAILVFEDSGISHYVCSNEHYHLYYERKYQSLIKIADFHSSHSGLKVLGKVAQNTTA